MATTRTYRSKTPVYGLGIDCQKVESKDFQDQANNFNYECKLYMQNVLDADTYVQRLNESVDPDSVDPLMQVINTTVETIVESNLSLEKSLTSFPKKVMSKAQELDNNNTYYQITATLSDELESKVNKF